jgi:hypothetical protein
MREKKNLRLRDYHWTEYQQTPYEHYALFLNFQ